MLRFCLRKEIILKFNLINLVLKSIKLFLTSIKLLYDKVVIIVLIVKYKIIIIFNLFQECFEETGKDLITIFTVKFL